ncbi:MAG: (Fe-S)-binding protein [Candidatus Neomarinimicrobiota bacterium]
MTLPVPERVLLSILTIATLALLFYEIWRRLQIVNKGTGQWPVDRPGQRLVRVFKEVILHERVIGGRVWPGIMHGFVFWGFIVFAVITLDHFAAGLGYPLLTEKSRHLYSLVAIPVAVLVSLGILALAFRRFVSRPEPLGKLSPSSGLVAIFIFLLMATYLYGETNPPSLASRVNWWIHAVTILVFLIVIPRSKHLHLVFAPFNIFFRPFHTPDHGTVKVDLEASEDELDDMLEGLTRLSRNQTLDVFSCVECGRCTEVCPANRGGGLLDPKHHFILDLRKPLIDSGDVAVMDQIDVEAGWECTTCQACTYACPVGNQVEKADEIRKIQVLVEGNVPQEYQKLFINLQETGNTEGATRSPLAERLSPYTPDAEYLLWLGCFARYEMDPNFTKAVNNFIKILDAAGVSYGVLKDEWCSGDPANRLGEKMTYQLLMEHNLKQLSQAKKVATLCPHCLVNLDTEYRKYAPVSYSVEHHTQVIDSLIQKSRIRVKPGNNERMTFHDPCYLARVAEEVRAPRRVVGAVASNTFELEEHGRKTLCCGAGGGLWWKKEGTGRTHLVRAQQIVDSGCDTVITGCNFCYGMFNQGLGPLTPEGSKPVRVKDVADIVAENLA